MQASEMIADWYESQLVGVPVENSFTALKAQFGSAAAVARELSTPEHTVAARTVQRYVNHEAGGRGPSARNPATMTPAMRARFDALVVRAPDAALAKRIKRDGLTIARFAGEMVVSNKSRTVDRQPGAGDNHIAGADLDDYLDAAARGDWEAAAQAWQDAFFGNEGHDGAYTVPGASLPDITRLDMEIG